MDLAPCGLHCHLNQLWVGPLPHQQHQRTPATENESDSETEAEDPDEVEPVLTWDNAGEQPLSDAPENDSLSDEEDSPEPAEIIPEDSPEVEIIPDQEDRVLEPEEEEETPPPLPTRKPLWEIKFS